MSVCSQENLKKKQQLPTTPTSLSALRDTTTAHPTISHLPSSPVTDLPIDASEECSTQIQAAQAQAASVAENIAAAAAASVEADAGSDDKDGDKDSKKKKNRCATCRKKDLSAAAEDFSARFTDTVTSTIAVLTTERWELRKLDVTTP
ncbi:hypothetical protein NQ314_019894 [Rhamnusium bicolor]|uniref:Uncharacterized protein n=1 Tax=Rhamnusium bicolor TaxID=1586634 RepID=A0AAV8WMA7_9CUCU|nr:hypothetical protein NQ314_019894 [Rhamnusium bicolor]